jgi:hypothetical protein
MDDIVKKAMAKWPNVPHCYGWLALDARGAWRMRDERAQHLGLPGDKVIQQALLAFINRNYLADERGCWYFQNGPQRVYLNLETTPFVARTDPQQGLVLQTGEALASLDAAFLTELGELIVQSGGKVAQVDDRDMAQLLPDLALDGAGVTDEALMAWLDGTPGSLTLRYRGTGLAVERIAREGIPHRFGFVRVPAPA